MAAGLLGTALGNVVARLADIGDFLLGAVPSDAEERAWTLADIGHDMFGPDADHVEALQLNAIRSEQADIERQVAIDEACEVLAMHHPLPRSDGRVQCGARYDDVDRCTFVGPDRRSWREHVAPLIVDALST